MKCMKKCGIYGLAGILILLTGKVEAQKIALLKTTSLNYPSASTVEFVDNKLYVIGDDAPHLLILDGEHRLQEQVRLFQSGTKRISKKEKADIESTVSISLDKKNYIIGISSLSARGRDKVMVVDADKGKKGAPREWSISSRPADGNIKDLNIEGAALINGLLVLANRAHHDHPHNHLIIGSLEQDKGINLDKASVIHLELPGAKDVLGLSGLAYVPEKDLLLFTATTEYTGSTTADGPIGDSYIGYVTNISQKLDDRKLQADVLVNVSKQLGQTEPQKIEGIAVESVQDNVLTLHLAADNDNGKSNLFKVKLTL